MNKKFAYFFAAMIAGSMASAHAADWLAPQEPFALYGNTYYVGTGDISALLITSPQGHILIDVGATRAAPIVAKNIRSLGYKVEDIRYILNSHAHEDHAGGIAELQKLSGATVLTSAASMQILASGQPDKTDPQLADLEVMAPLTKLRVVEHGEVVRLGPLALTAHMTPGHTKGGTSWTWQETEKGRLANMVFADSLTAFSGKGVPFSANPGFPDATAAVEKSIATINAFKCDVLVTAHPAMGGLWERKDKQAALGNVAFIDQKACVNYTAKARARLEKTLAADAAAAQASKAK